MKNYGKPSAVQYMDVRPKHFGTNISNPMTRWGDAPYVKCTVKGCGLLYTQGGIRGHQLKAHGIVATTVPVAPRKKR